MSTYRQIRAKYRGTCDTCGTAIQPGDPILWDPTSSEAFHNDTARGCAAMIRRRTDGWTTLFEEIDADNPDIIPSTLGSDMTEKEWQGNGPRLDERNEFHNIDDDYFS